MRFTTDFIERFFGSYILSSDSIKNEMAHGNITITGEKSLSFDDLMQYNQIQPCSLDLRRGVYLDDSNHKYKDDLVINGTSVVYPFEQIKTMPWITKAFVLRSSFLRLGLTHHSDPKFWSLMQFENPLNDHSVILFSNTNNPVSIDYKERFGQLIFGVHPQFATHTKGVGSLVYDPNLLPDDAETHDNIVVFRAGDEVNRLRPNFGPLCIDDMHNNREKIFERIDFNDINIGDIVSVRVDRPLKIDAQTAILYVAINDCMSVQQGNIPRHDPLGGLTFMDRSLRNVPHVTYGTGLIDPGFESDRWYINVKPRLKLDKGDVIAIGIVYHFLEPISMEYGEDIGSHY